MGSARRTSIGEAALRRGPAPLLHLLLPLLPDHTWLQGGDEHQDLPPFQDFQAGRSSLFSSSSPSSPHTEDKPTS